MLALNDLERNQSLGRTYRLWFSCIQFTLHRFVHYKSLTVGLKSSMYVMEVEDSERYFILS